MKTRFSRSPRSGLLAALFAAACLSASGQDLWIDFNSTTQDGGPHNQDGYQEYNAGHEVAADFVTRSYGAFGTTVTVTPGWPNTTDNRVRQMIDRGAGNDATWINDNNDLDLVTDWLGADTRTGNGGNGNWDGAAGGTPTYLTLTLGDLPRGRYAWTSFHHDTEHVHGFFQIEISTDGGGSFSDLGQDFYLSDSTAGGNPDSDDPGNGFPGPQVGPDATTLISTVNLEFTSTGDDVVLRFAALANSAVHRQLVAINGFQLIRTGGAGVRITGFSRDPETDELTIRWESKAGKLYNVRAILDPSSAEPADWPLLDPHEDVAATPPENTLVIPRPADEERYFVIEEFNAPPVKVYREDFETGAVGWTATKDPSDTGATVWELGTPDAGLLGGPPAAHAGANCYGTDLDANYVEDTLIRLQSPPIDLSGIVGGTISYWQWTEIELTFDSGTVRVLDAADNSEIGVLAGPFDGASAAWEERSHDIPAAADGKTVILEFVLDTDEFGNQAGFYVDDICVEGPAR